MTDTLQPVATPVRYPGNSSFVIGLRFLNVLDPDFNMFSPVRVQAWIATGVAAGDLISQANAWVTGSSMVWAGMAHVLHLVDKSNRSKAIVAAAKAGAPGA